MLPELGHFFLSLEPEQQMLMRADMVGCSGIVNLAF